MQDSGPKEDSYRQTSGEEERREGKFVSDESVSWGYGG